MLLDLITERCFCLVRFMECPTSATLGWDRPGVGQTALYMFVEAVVLFVFIILLEVWCSLFLITVVRCRILSD